MKMQLNSHKLIMERQQRAWSQSQLAQASGLSLRTIQRIENSGKASLETAKAIASVYDLKVTDFFEQDCTDQDKQLEEASIERSLSLLSSEGATLTITVFILSTLIMLFLLATGIAPAWINEFRDDIFSQRLSAFTLNAISVCITIAFTLSLSLTAGIGLDALRNKGLIVYLKHFLKSNNISALEVLTKLQTKLLQFARLMVKPMVISSVVLVVAGGAIYLDMEDYQKANIVRFYSERFSKLLIYCTF